MNIFQKLFSRKKGRDKEGQKHDGNDPGYLACPVVAAELKRGKFDSLPEEKQNNQEEAGYEAGKDSAGKKS